MAQGIRTGDGKELGEVQGMTGIEKVFSLGQWILKSEVLLGRAHIRAFFTSLHVSLLSIFLSIHLCHSLYVFILIYFLIYIPCGCRAVQAVLYLILLPFLQNFSLSCLALGTCTCSNFYALVFALFTFTFSFLLFLTTHLIF